MRYAILVIALANIGLASVARADDCDLLREEWQKTACKASCGILPTSAWRPCGLGLCEWNPRAECESAKQSFLALVQEIKKRIEDEARAKLEEIKKRGEEGKKFIEATGQRVITGASAAIANIVAAAPSFIADTICRPVGNWDLCKLLVKARTIPDVLVNYRAKRDEARAKRSGPPPIATDYDENAARSAAGIEGLAKKAADWERDTVDLHLRDHLIVPGLKVRFENGIGKVFGIWSGMQNSGFHTGLYLAARAFKADVTRANADFKALHDALTGVYNVMTIAKAPNGGVLRTIKARPGDGACRQPPAPAAGVVVRAFVRIAPQGAEPSPNADADFAGTTVGDVPYGVYEFEGRILTGFRPPTKHRGRRPTYKSGTFRFIANVSRDEIHGLFFGLEMAHEVLSRHHPNDPWLPRIKEAVGDFMGRFVANGFKLVDLDGCVTSIKDNPNEGDLSNMDRPDLLLQNLAWLKVAHRVTGDALFKSKYDALVQGKGLLGGAAAPWLTGVLGVATALGIGEIKELVPYLYQDFNVIYNFLPVFHLLRLEESAEIRRVFANYFFGVVWPLFGDTRTPLFDFVALLAARNMPADVERLVVASLAKRPAAVLAQHRDRPFPFGKNPTTGKRGSDGLDAGVANDFAADSTTAPANLREALKDPLIAYLREKLPEELKVRLADRCYGGSAWALGPGLMPTPTPLSIVYPYRLCFGSREVEGPYVPESGPANGWSAWAGHEFLVQYWMGRCFKLIPTGGGQ